MFLLKREVLKAMGKWTLQCSGWIGASLHSWRSPSVSLQRSCPRGYSLAVHPLGSRHDRELMMCFCQVLYLSFF